MVLPGGVRLNESFQEDVEETQARSPIWMKGGIRAPDWVSAEWAKSELMYWD